MARQDGEIYKIPENVVNMTIHHMHGIDEPAEVVSAESRFQEIDYGFIADFVAIGIPEPEIEDFVNADKADFAHWPEKDVRTDLLWLKNPDATEVLEDLARIATKFCYGKNADEPIGGNFVTVGAEMNSQQFALAGLIYARHTGLVREVPELGQPGMGPLYVARGTFSENMVNILLGEE